MLHLGGDALHPVRVGGVLEQAHPGRVAGERAVGEGVHDEHPHGTDASARPRRGDTANPREVALGRGAAASQSEKTSLTKIINIDVRWRARASARRRPGTLE
ncbi:hypothetical protein GCM10009735_81160 [Actinomadura chokoriensis]